MADERARSLNCRPRNLRRSLELGELTDAYSSVRELRHNHQFAAIASTNRRRVLKYISVRPSMRDTGALGCTIE